MRATKAMGLVMVLVGLAPLGCTSGAAEDEVLPGVSAIVFAKRAYVRADGEHDVAGGAGQVIDYLRYTPGGGVFVLSPPAQDGELRELTRDFEDVDIGGLDLSFDGKEVVFSMRHADSGGNYHLYKAAIDGKSRPKQLTFGPQDDVRPIYVPGKRIAFVTNQSYTEMGTRADEYNHSRQVTQLATISSETGDADRRLCSHNLSHSADPFLLSDGTIGFSRWEHLGPVNDVKLFRMNPDCSSMLAIAGQHGKDFNSLVQAREVREGVLLAIATSREGTIQAGAVMEIDVRTRSGSAGVDEQEARFTSLTPEVPLDRDPVPDGAGRYRSPFMLDDGKLLVSWALGDVNTRNELAETAPDFGLYLYDPESRERVLVYNDDDSWELYAQPVRPREQPPERRSRIDTPSDPGQTGFGARAAVIGSIDITQTSLDEVVQGGQFAEPTPLSEALAQAEKVRIIEGFSSEIGPVREFGLTMHEGAAILGEVDVQPDGSWEAHVVPYLPYHLQPIDRFGLSIRSEGLWIQAMPGENRTCGGCHESRAGAASATSGATLAQQLPLEFKDLSRVAIADRIELPWHDAVEGSATVQQLLDSKCASCHDGGANDPFAGRSYTVTVPPEESGGMELVYEVPYLLLTSERLATYYENEPVSYPASYLSLLYPSAMMGESVVQGDVPDPPWVIPGSARESRLIQKINATPADERAGTEWAWPTAPHPEDVGVELTPEERLMLIRMADLGGQYYSRRNVDGAEQWLSMEAEEY